MEDANAHGRPSRWRRAAAGAWHVPAGIGFLLRHPSLWPLAALPVFLAGILLLSGLLGGLFALPLADDWLTSERERRPIGGLLFALAVYTALPIAGLLIGLSIALLLAAPILERLSRETERRVRGAREEASRGLRWEIAQSMRGAFYFALRAPAIFLVSLIPFVGPIASGLWGAHALAFQMTETPLQRQGLDFWSRRSWHRRNRAESLGFGLAGLLTLFVPFANLLLAPALTVGATRLVLELIGPTEPLAGLDDLEPAASLADLD